jgi:deoxycytidylate deaminase
MYVVRINVRHMWGTHSMGETMEPPLPWTVAYARTQVEAMDAATCSLDERKRNLATWPETTYEEALLIHAERTAILALQEQNVKRTAELFVNLLSSRN